MKPVDVLRLSRCNTAVDHTTNNQLTLNHKIEFVNILSVITVTVGERVFERLSHPNNWYLVRTADGVTDSSTTTSISAIRLIIAPPLVEGPTRINPAITTVMALLRAFPFGLPALAMKHAQHRCGSTRQARGRLIEACSEPRIAPRKAPGNAAALAAAAHVPATDTLTHTAGTRPSGRLRR